MADSLKIWRRGGGQVNMRWVYSALLFEIGLTDLPKSGGGGHATQPLTHPVPPSLQANSTVCKSSMIDASGSELFLMLNKYFYI